MKAKFILIFSTMLFSVFTYGCDCNIAGTKSAETDTTKFRRWKQKTPTQIINPHLKAKQEQRV
jgi:hypothetical protein